MSKLSQEIKECVSCPQINGKPYGRWGTLNSEQRINIWNLAEQCEFYEELADKSMEKITKYKRAFEIINKHSKVDYIENTNINDLGKDYNLFICEINSIEDKEEYELLEELMKGENS